MRQGNNEFEVPGFKFFARPQLETWNLKLYSICLQDFYQQLATFSATLTVHENDFPSPAADPNRFFLSS
ncbi:hypothetical protein GCM10028805_21390 [Spirosoma harenae]